MRSRLALIAAVALAAVGCRVASGAPQGPTPPIATAARAASTSAEPSSDVGNACREQVADLEQWLGTIEAAGLPLALALEEGGARLVERAGGRIDEAAPVIHIAAAKLVVDGVAIAPESLERELAHLLQLRGAVLSGSPFVRTALCHVAVDADVHWERVVSFAEQAARAGVGRLSFVFADPARTPPAPPPSAIDAQLARLRDATAARRQQVIAELLAFVYQDCPTALKVLGQMGAQPVGDLKQVIFDELPAAIAACGCAADAPSVKALHWALFASGRPLAGVIVALSATSPVTVLRAPPDRPWSEAHAALAAVAADEARQPVQLARAEPPPPRKR